MGKDLAEQLKNGQAQAAHDARASGVAPVFFADETLVTETMAMCTYNWRDADPEETLLFFALRLAKSNLIRSTPQQILAQGTDFAYMRQLRSELKA